jgi:hypothetical protein
VTSLPIASAASRLSRIARIIRPQGERSARSASQRMARRTASEEQGVAEAADDRRGGGGTGADAVAERQDPVVDLQDALVGDGRGMLVTFLTPRVSQFSFFSTARMISEMPSVAIAR